MNWLPARAGTGDSQGSPFKLQLRLKSQASDINFMNLMQLEIFCSVFKERSFSRAADALGLTQPTISIRIKEFEEELGSPLFNRLGREIEPTDAGNFLYEQALPLLAQRRKLSERMTSFLNRVEGPLIVGTSSAAGEHLLPGIMMAFQVEQIGRAHV